MKSQLIGGNTSPEVTHISARGIWVLWNGREHFLDYEKFPWFKDARVSELLNLQVESIDHLYWPDLDVDLSLAILENPEQYPLVSKLGLPEEPRRRAVS